MIKLDRDFTPEVLAQRASVFEESERIIAECDQDPSKKKGKGYYGARMALWCLHFNSVALIKFNQRVRGNLKLAGIAMKSSGDGLPEAVKKLQDDYHNLKSEHARTKMQLAGSDYYQLLITTNTVGPWVVKTQLVNGFDVSMMKAYADVVIGTAVAHVVLLASADGGKVSMVMAATREVSKHLHCGNALKDIAKYNISGGGGGSPTMAQAGGKNNGSLLGVLVRGSQYITSCLIEAHADVVELEDATGLDPVGRKAV